ncbi:MAG: EAL domain-containing response regulator [Kofleriaceae bacterium]|nr:EAL domain-containing response regulator [Kofleriaceae bacterium]MBP6835823.1 EAL domain-containing response regulator [Kofleriaceae bacterium]MBP9206932.1 EAL domain-containing response regulator [Kofleriaceae bacterium]
MLADAIPELPADLAGATGPAEGSGTIVRPRVLVVDDDPRILASLARSLERAGFFVERADSVASARAAMAREMGDIVVTDLSLADGDGIEVLAAARERDPDVGVLFLSGSAELDPAVRALEGGALRYLRKPVSAAELCGAVSAAFAVRRRRRRGSGWGPREDAERGRRLTEALAELFLVFQPIVSCDRAEIVAYEVLMRSRHSSLGRPDRMLAAAEQLERIIELGRTVRRALIAALPSLPGGVDIFLNLHPQELDDPELYDPASPLAAYASRLVLEITERAAVANPGEAVAKLRQLRALGYRIAVDDLGSGYASLSLVAELAPDVLKIDMSLVRGVHRDPTKQMLLRALIQLGTQMSVGTVIEGVETTDDLATVVDAGADLVQGYLFARPATPAPGVDRSHFAGAGRPLGRGSSPEIALRTRASSPLGELARMAGRLAATEGGELQRVADEMLAKVAEVEALLEAFAEASKRGRGRVG